MKRATFFSILLGGLVFSQPHVYGIFSKSDDPEEITRKIASSRGSDKSSLYSQLGDIHFKKGELEKAAEAYEKALQFETNQAQKAHIYRYLGKSYAGFDRLDRAIDAAEQAVAYNRKYWRCHRDLARLYEKVLLYRKAVSSYRSAIKYNAKDPSLYMELGRTWRKLGLYKPAEANLKKSQDLGEHSVAFFQELSFLYEGGSRFAEAAAAEQKTISEDSTAKDWGRLVYLAALAGDRERANYGLNNLRKMETSSDTVLFYEELVDLTQRSPQDILTMNVSDPTLKALVQSVRPKTAP